MPNPAIYHPAATPEQEVQPSANGVLSWMGGDRIAQAARQLPAAGPEHAAKPRREVVVQGVPHFGAVRVTYELDSYRHGRSRHWHWRAVRADPLMLKLPVVARAPWLVDWRLKPGWRAGTASQPSR